MCFRAQLLAELPENVSTVLISSEEFSRAGSLDTDARTAALAIPGVRKRQGGSRAEAPGRMDRELVQAGRRPVPRLRDPLLRALLPGDGGHAPRLSSPVRPVARSGRTGELSRPVLRRPRRWSGHLPPHPGHSRSAGPGREELSAVRVPRYESVRAIDTVGLRILNSYRLADRETRTDAARSIYDVAPTGDIELMSADLREEIQAMCSPINERLEAEWFAHPVPGLRFGSPPRASTTSSPSGLELVDYVDQVLAVCESARATAQPESASGRDGE